MGKPTGRIETRLRGTGLGSSHYGGCERCGNQMSEAFVRETLHEAIREDGSTYFNEPNSGAFGHRSCLVRDFGAPTLPDANSILNV